MANKKNKGINIENYNRLISENPFLNDLLEKVKKEFSFPVKSLLEIGTGTGLFLTKFLIEKERDGSIEKFYGIEPVSEFFEESKRHIVRLSHTDATRHQYYGGNPFDIITYSFVTGHIFDDKKAKFIDNIYNNLQDEGGKLIIIDSFIPDYSDPEERKKMNQKMLNANISYFKSLKDKGQYIMNYFTNVIHEQHEDYHTGNYKTSIEKLIELLDDAGFEEIETKNIRGKGKGKWKDMGYYIITAIKD